MTAHDVAQALPDIDSLRDLCRSMAMAEAILNPDGERYHSYNAKWSETEELASMSNGSGDEYDIVFAPIGAYLRGFDHESPLSPYHHDDVPTPWPGVLDSVPEPFQCYVDEPDFTDEDGTPVVTVCVWREADARSWSAGRIAFPEGHPDPDGSDWLFELLLTPTPEAFQEFAEDYYETTVDIEAVRHLYDLRPLDRAQIARLNPSASVEEVAEAAAVIGYPMAEDLVSDPAA
ncbi:hypothetical protein GCM10011579_012020 [Streptomyces albiflavescens]|uniref:Uncharacterized protein n=1 Tax=Streptomyces albiflavescens TaxID=1623582 RepID=A0A917XV17_9ACTN|nr:hypothetical protein [Streptomyces albiflavescens]GGN53638.1 hypothetical protein GCM10011579_012020 [Streptomyces albiflavescens]